MTPFERWAIWLTTAATAVTGLAWAGMEYLLAPVDPWAVIHHPWQPAVLKAHILVAPLLLFALGLVTMRHIWRHWRNGQAAGRRTGLHLVAWTGPMVVTGYLIQVVTHEGALALLSWGHLGTGALFAAGLVAHQLVVRRRGVRAPGSYPPPRPASAPAPVPGRVAGASRTTRSIPGRRTPG